ncbi:MAG TPA: hypothetical protein VIL20_19810 [Sandaracinaceae bacterium]
MGYGIRVVSFVALVGSAASGCASIEASYADFGPDGPYGYAVSPYADWFAYTPGQRGPWYHPYPNLEYFLEYRPIYPG